jgi:hypothetical protein
MMQTSITFTLAAGLSICGVSPAAADSDIAVWRWHVSNVLRAQQSQDDPLRLREGRASAIDAPGSTNSFEQRYERYLADGSLAPAENAAQR